MSSVRLFFVGGLTSFRALFAWLSPWVYVPSLLVAPVFQILLFASLGRAAGVGSDAFFLVGNAVQYVAVPCLFGIANSIANERTTQTLGIILASPARRLPLFVGRAVPTLANGAFVALFSLAAGALLLGVHIPASAWPRLVVVVLTAAASCTGLGMLDAALALRVRETSVSSNILVGVLLIFCGVNVPPGSLPGWMAAVGGYLPLTHAIAAARAVAGGAGLAEVGTALLHEAGTGAAYFALGLLALAWLERRSRLTACLERS